MRAADETKPVNNQTLGLERKRIEACQCDECEVFDAAVPDLVRLDRYKRRALSRQKRVIREFITLKTGRDTHRTSAVEERVS